MNKAEGRCCCVLQSGDLCCSLKHALSRSISVYSFDLQLGASTCSPNKALGRMHLWRRSRTSMEKWWEYVSFTALADLQWTASFHKKFDSQLLCKDGQSKQNDVFESQKKQEIER